MTNGTVELVKMGKNDMLLLCLRKGTEQTGIRDRFPGKERIQCAMDSTMAFAAGTDVMDMEDALTGRTTAMDRTCITIITGRASAASVPSSVFSSDWR